MSISIFKFGSRHGTTIRLSHDRKTEAGRQLRINDRFPDFTARSTKGRIDFSDWADGSYVLLVAHPAAFTPVCTTEIRALAERHYEFEERKIKVIALTGDSLDDVREWSAEIERDIGMPIPFPHIADKNHAIIKGCGFSSNDPMIDGRYCARRSLLIDPRGVVRMVMDYPLAVGRSVDETLRCIDALVLAERLDAFTPSDWQFGEPLLLDQEKSPADGKLSGKLPEGRESLYFKTVQIQRREKSSARLSKTGRLPVINNAELRRLVNEHNQRANEDLEIEDHTRPELFSMFRF